MKRILPFLLLFVFVLTSCSKTVESESENWGKNNKRVTELLALYPSFTGPLNEQLEKAKGLWNEAQGISDEEQKIAKMAEANALIGSGFVGDLSNADRKIADTRRKMAELSGKANDQFDLESVKITNSNVSMTLSDAENMLRRGATDIPAAQTILTAVTTKINSANTQVNTLSTSFKKKTDLERKQKKEAKNQTNKSNTQDAKSGEETQTATSWKCGYCGTQNTAKALECSSCGAPH